MGIIKERYRARYRALGRTLEIERLHQSEMMNEDTHKPLDRHRLAQKEYSDQTREILTELNDLEDLLY
ncbi:hypothetical protein SDC9_184111 [bioreactor metagenome]|uniref:Uncharacterized protein n=1 Tax=bioreactor metagenome TaxID=1076179 RepID=A0A645HC37_9ZZZZ